MKNFLIRVLVGGIALWVAALVVGGVDLAEDQADWTDKLVTIVLVALIFGVINAFVKPLAMFLSLPFIVLTLGLFMFVVNAFMLQITEWISDALGLSFSIDEFFWSAIWAALIITLVSWPLDLIFSDD
ncbi:MAG: phage holin family protein [Ornithinibacter sp.]